MWVHFFLSRIPLLSNNPQRFFFHIYITQPSFDIRSATPTKSDSTLMTVLYSVSHSVQCDTPVFHSPSLQSQHSESASRFLPSHLPMYPCLHSLSARLLPIFALFPPLLLLGRLFVIVCPVARLLPFASAGRFSKASFNANTFLLPV